MDIAHLEVLNKKRQDLLPLFKPFKNTFYLAGGTALALILGHRDSIDFDFFSEQSFDTDKLFIQLQSVFQEFEIQKIQEETNTLTIVLDQEIKISFFSYPYKY